MKKKMQSDKSELKFLILIEENIKIKIVNV